MTSDILHQPLARVARENPLLVDFFRSFQLDPAQESKSFIQLMDSRADDFFIEQGTTRSALTGLFIDFVEGLVASDTSSVVEVLEVEAGYNKSGQAEACSLSLVPGEITCIVGPTGSGKSRLLADIEWLANADTPTKRKVRINGELAGADTLNHFGGKLIAQITQNMNFVLDMDVQSFLQLHAQSRFLEDADAAVAQVIALANELSGEAFEPTTPVTFLSGGQSRALMIADVACIGQAPIVLIDEIENAGVNKKKALDLLVRQDKIVLMATHDPLLILLADKRVVIRNGGMAQVLETNAQERELYSHLEALDQTLQKTRNFFRSGQSLTRISELID